MTARLRAGLATSLLAAAVAMACGDPNAPRANFLNYADTLQLYELNGGSRGAPAGISLVAGIGGTSAVTVDAAFAFDVAVDINPDGQPALYPVRSVAAPFLGRHRVGIRRTDQAFDAILEAPTGDYVYDSVAVLDVGEVVLLESADAQACGGFGVIYAKLVVDSIRPATNQLFTRVTADPNCGFRSLVVPGPPDR